jgi:predicted ATPase/DNA-binding winged helix-turn-helix (wHTH) protein
MSPQGDIQNRERRLSERNESMREQAVAFGPYLLFRSRKILLENNRSVPLGSRALDILIALVERAGEVVSKNDLMKYAWPNTVVEDNNLRVHVTAIRKILGDGHGNGNGNSRYIINVTGRGYSFVAPVTRVDVPSSDPELESKALRRLPGPLTHVVGRDEIIAMLVAQMSGRRHISIIGPGGVGKTTVGIVVAQQLAKSYQTVCFVDLSVIQDPALVPSTVATVIGISAVAKDPAANLAAYLRDTRYLLVLDNCEHVIGSVAVLAEYLLRETSGVDILATSREPLLSEGEYVFDLAPLPSPPVSPELDAAAALTFPAVQLFVERAVGGSDSFRLTDANANTIAGICRRLDGIPLAIELVAARVNMFGVDALAKGFGDDMLLTTQGRRTAGSRHQSLRATLDWSYKILPPLEKNVLRRLAVFTGLFSAEAAAAVVSGEPLTTSPVLNALMSLVGKSLLTTDVSDSTIRYRLLHTTRAYASERLTESDEMSEMLRRHAEYFRSALGASSDAWEKMTRVQWLAQYGGMADDVRAATDWAFGPGGNLELGVSLTVASLPFGFQLSLIHETIKRAAVALEILSRASPPQPVSVIRLNNAVAGLHLLTGIPDELVLASARRSLELARQTGDPKDSIEPLITQAVVQWQQGDFAASLETTDSLERVAARADDGIASLLADRVSAQTQHFLGNHDRARTLAERVLRHPAQSTPLRYKGIPVDRRVSMRIILARIAWLSGNGEQAERVATESLELAVLDGPVSICQALALAACPIAFWRGDLSLASRRTQNLLDYSRRYSLNRWMSLAQSYEFCAHFLLGHDSALTQTQSGIANAVPEGAFFRETLATICDCWIDEQTVERARRGSCGWSGPEILRAAAARELGGSRSTAALSKAAATYKDSLEIACTQNAVAWQLRTTLSLADVRIKQGRERDAAKILHDVCEKLSPGEDTADLQKARLLLKSLDAG